MTAGAAHPGRGRHRPARATHPWIPRPSLTWRAVCHAAVEVPFVVVALVQSAQGWRPTQDDAVIAIRSWAVLTSRSPLLGQITQATGCTGHRAFSPGPLQYWLLAIPVRLDPVHGVLWGAALAAAVGMAVCVESAWAVRGVSGAIAVAAGGTVLVATQTVVLVNPIWNPYLGVVWFAATCMAAWTVGTGRLRWWPVLVICASVAAQTHLEYTVPATVLAIGAPLAGMARARPQRWRWVPAGVVAAAACWAAPLAQQMTGRPGNVSVLLRCAGSRYTLGGTFGLRALSSAVAPRPLWLQHPPTGTLDQIVSTLGRGSPAVGIATLLALAAVTVGAWKTRQSDLAALAGVALVAGASAVWLMAAVPQGNRAEIGYLDVILWPVGMLIWGVAGWTVVRIATSARLRRVLRLLRDLPVTSTASALGAWVLVAVLLVGAAINTAVVASDATAESAHAAGGPGGFRGVSLGAAAVEHAVPRGPVMVGVIAKNGYASYALLYGMLWVLISDGRQATAPEPFRGPIDPPARLLPAERRVTVTVLPSGSVARTVVVDPRR